MFASTLFSIAVSLLSLGAMAPPVTPPVASAVEQVPAQPKLHPALWVNRQINELTMGGCEILHWIAIVD